MATQPVIQDLPDGPVAAALVAGGLGSAAIGLMTVLAEASMPINDALDWWHPAGSLTGETGVGVIVFLVSWGLLHLAFRGKEVGLTRMMTIALALFGLGLLGTFPLFFQLFAAE